MSTRANVIIKDRWSQIYFYRHSDGYPSGVEPTLKKFVEAVNRGKLRKDAMQSSGWLIILGAEEYETNTDLNNLDDNLRGWKVGAYEPTDNIHGDIEYLYIIDLERNPVECYVLDDNFENWKEALEKKEFMSFDEALKKELEEIEELRNN